MKLSEYDYNLPDEYIAQTPIEPRDHSKLMIINSEKKEIQDNYFYDIIDQLTKNDVLVLNKTKVINARLHGKIKKGKKTLNSKETGNFLWKTVEIFLHKQITEDTWECRVYPGKNLKVGKNIKFELGLDAEVIEETFTGRIIKFNKSKVDFLETIEKLGDIPLPPYIKEKLDKDERYQTIWAETEGSVAAPTASLHFTPELIKKIENLGVKIEKVLLHIGLGTFMPILKENILEHEMHSEYLELEDDVAKRLNKYKSEGKRIIAVGTTSIRVLETMSDENGIIKSGKKDTNIFIYPGYKWKFVDSIITNFHLPKSTLLMLVSSFAGKDFIKKVYKHAIETKYRFFSFGDAMFIKNKKK